MLFPGSGYPIVEMYSSSRRLSILRLINSNESRNLKFVVISGLLSEFSADAIEIRPLNL